MRLAGVCFFCAEAAQDHGAGASACAHAPGTSMWRAEMEKEEMLQGDYCSWEQNHPCGILRCGVSQGQVLIVLPSSSLAVSGTSILAIAGPTAAPLLISLQGQDLTCPGLWWQCKCTLNKSQLIAGRAARNELSFCPTNEFPISTVKEQPDCRVASRYV